VSLAVYLPFVAGLLLARTVRRLARRAVPGISAWVLAAAAAVIAATQIWALVLLAGSLIDDLPGLPKLPVPDVVSALSWALLAWCLIRAGAALRRQHRHRKLLRGVVGTAELELVVVSGPRAEAFAVAGRPGRVVVTETMLRALTPAQRKVLLAHERAHLAERHPLALSLVDLTVAVSPMLAPVRAAVSFLCERRADEVAAGVVGDREAVAEALAVAALARSGPVPAPAFTELAVVDRVSALLVPSRSVWLPVVVTALALMGAALTATADATDDLATLLHLVG
jgi:Zn-dependent protease with chaperone function